MGSIAGGIERCTERTRIVLASLEICSSDYTSNRYTALSVIMNQRLQFLWKQMPTVASLAVGILPVVILVIWFDVPRKILGLGAMAYAAGAVGLKLPLYHLLVVKVLHKKLSNAALGIFQGIVSAISELGAALAFYFFVVPDLTFAKLVGFGIAAGSVEAVILPFMNNPLEGTPLEEHSEETNKSAAENMTIQWLGVVERILASVIHVGARGLTYVSYATGNIVPMIIGLAGFASVDGRAYFAHLEKWRFDTIEVLVKFYRFLGAVACSLVVLFVILYYALIH